MDGIAQDCVFVKNFPGTICDDGISVPPSFFDGDAKNANYTQAFGFGILDDDDFSEIVEGSGKYLCVYPDTMTNKSITAQVDDDNVVFLPPTGGTKQLLTTIIIRCPNMTCSTLDKGTLLDGLIISDAKIVTNELGFSEAVATWNGNAVDKDKGDKEKGLVTYIDFIATIATAIETCDDIELKSPSTFMLSSLLTVAQLDGIDLSQFNPDCTSGNIPNIDVNGDGKINIIDVVAIRNLHFKSLSSRVSITNLERKVVPKECDCPELPSFDLDFFIPDECSDYCIQPGCFGKLWISNVELLPQAQLIAIDVSYSVSCDKTSGFQFELNGVNKIEKIDDHYAIAVGNTNGLLQELYSGDGSDNKRTYIAFAGDEKSYVAKGKGVLVRLLISAKEFHSNREYLAGVASQLAHQYKSQVSVMHTPSVPSKEEIIRMLYGIRITNWRILSNDVVTAPIEGWDISEDGETWDDLTNIKELIENGEYDELYDAEGDGTLDVADIQTVYHSLQPNAFGEDLDNEVGFLVAFRLL